jgi:UDP-N-acetylmuramoyl-tripeptide--D-alanyl-D-alanine ligase
MGVPFRAEELVRWTHGELLAGDPATRFDAVSIDTRTLTPGALFVAVRGPNHDAHDYLDRAVAGGAGGLLVERGRPVPEGCPAVAVEDTTEALGALAAGHRAGFRGPLVAITGSNGKTTTKEMCAEILARAGATLRTRGNLNNQFGLPLTLLSREAEQRFAVVELGMNHRGEIAQLARIARPTVGVITNVGTAHIEFLHSQDEIAKEKGDLFASLPEDGIAVANADDPRVTAQAERGPARTLFFGRGPGADVRAADVQDDGTRFRFTLLSPQGAIPVEVTGLGDTTVANALAAAAGALAAGASLKNVAEGLAAFAGVSGRMQPRRLAGGLHVIDDSYNANPQSVDAALRSLAHVGGPHRTLAVLGDMGELGDATRDAHRRIGARAAELGIDFLLALGEHAEAVAQGARCGGMAADRVHVEPSHEAAGRRARTLLGSGDWVLVKGSRSMRMERVVEALEAQA